MPDRMYIGKLAQSAGVNPKTVRYYEEIGLLPEPERTDSNYRLYTPDDGHTLEFIKKAQTLGMALGEIKDVLTIRGRGQFPCEHVRSLLADKLTELDRQIAQMRAFRHELAKYLDEVQERAEMGAEAAICPDIESFETDTHSATSVGS